MAYAVLANKFINGKQFHQQCSRSNIDTHVIEMASSWRALRDMLLIDHSRTKKDVCQYTNMAEDKFIKMASIYGG